MSVDEIYPWLFGLCKGACSDPNPFVRSTAIIGILKIADMTSFESTQYIEEIKEIVSAALKDCDLDVVMQGLLLGSVLI